LKDLSIIIVSYNTKELLLECLESIQKGRKKIDTEIYVVDNNSHDGSPQQVEKKYPDVILINNNLNLGFSKANNLALKKIKSKYVLILNPDTKLMPDTLTKMIEYISNDNQIGVATCRVELPNGDLDKDCRRHFPTPWRSFCHFIKLSKVFKGSQVFDQYYMGYKSEKTAHEVDSCVGAFMLVKTSAIEKVGLFDEDFFFYGEDLDWCWRFKEAGYKIMFTPITKITHYKGAASGIKAPSMHLSKATIESKKRAVHESTRAMELFYHKHYKHVYPSFLTWIVISSVKILEYFRLVKVQLKI